MYELLFNGSVVSSGIIVKGKCTQCFPEEDEEGGAEEGWLSVLVTVLDLWEHHAYTA